MTPKTILLVDDDPDIHMLLSAHLQEAGYQTASVYDGMSCVTAVRRTVPDLIVLDLGLPAGDGEATLRSVRNMAQLATVPVLVVSGRDAASWSEHMRVAGANGYLEKPVDPQRLVDTVRTLLGDQIPPALPAPTPAGGLQAAALACPHCGGEVGSLTPATVEALLARLQTPA